MTEEEWQKEIEGLTPEQKKELAHGILLLSIKPLYEKYTKNSTEGWEEYWFILWGLISCTSNLSRRFILEYARANDYATNQNSIQDLVFALALALSRSNNLYYDNYIFNYSYKSTLSGIEEEKIQLLFQKIREEKSIYSVDFQIPEVFYPLDRFVTGKLGKKEEEIIARRWVEVLESKSITTITPFLRLLRESIEGATQAQKRVRVLLLGNGGAGKSSLLEGFLNPEGKLQAYDATPRIEIRSDTVEGIETDFWDFGGQVIMHSTHNFFLNRQAIFVIVCNARADEQPDEWLSKLRRRIGSGVKSKVLIVYTFVENSEEKERFVFRRNTLQRRFGDVFEMDFYALSNKDRKDNHFERFRNALKETIKKEGAVHTITALHTKYRDAKSALIGRDALVQTAQELSKKSNTGEWTVETLIELLYGLGYIFPIESLTSRPLTEQRTFVWQKHWLTYGVYRLINSDMTRLKQGILTKNDFKSILWEGKTVYIDKKGRIRYRKQKNAEAIRYDDTGIDTLFEIVQNYGWAIRSHEHYEELIFPHAVSIDEPEALNGGNYPLDSASEYILYIDNMPDDLFFRFVALAQNHVRKRELLWRSGVMLFDVLDDAIYALVTVEEGRFRIQVKGDESYYLLQTIFYYLNRLLVHSSSDRMLSAKLFKRITEKGKSLLLDMAMMEDAEQAKQAIENMIRKEHKMATIHIGQLNVQGDAAIGNHNVIDKKTIGEITVHLKHIEKALREKGEIELADQAKALSKEATEDRSFLEKVGRFYEKVVDKFKDASAIDKGVDALNDALNALAGML